MATPEEALVSVRSGAPDWALVYAVHREAMHATARSILHNATVMGVSADDIVSTAMVEVMRKGVPPDVRSLGGYLGRIVIRRAIDAVRRRKHQDDQPFDPSTMAGPTGPSVEDEVVERIEARQTAALALDQLPPRERSVIVERVMRQRPRDEVAAELGVTPQRVSQLINQALARIRAVPAFTTDISFDEHPGPPTGGHHDRHT